MHKIGGRGRTGPVYFCLGKSRIFKLTITVTGIVPSQSKIFAEDFEDYSGISCEIADYCR